MSERNRVTPWGDVVAIPLRGAWLGNRGVIHGGSRGGRAGHDIVRSHTTTAWITCALEFHGWVAPKWEPRRWTALFFYDEAVALAAGHRPCALCRHADFVAYRNAVGAALGTPMRAPDLDRRLHAERRDPRTKARRLHEVAWGDVPRGAFVADGVTPLLVLGDRLVPWSEKGYGTAVLRPSKGTATVLTPPTSLAALSAGYRPHLRDGSGTGQGVTHLTPPAAPPTVEA